MSLALLDHLILTALLLVTDAEEWITFARPGIADGQPQSASASTRQWRKIVYGEPLFPSLRSPNEKVVEVPDEDDFGSPSSSSTRPLSSARPSSSASRPASMRQMRKILYGEPLFPSLSQGDPTESGSRSSFDDDAASMSSGSEFVSYASASVSTIATSHGYSSFYEKGVPPIPELPAQYRSTSRSSSSRPPSSLMAPSTSSSGSARRELPKPPTTPSFQQTLHRSRSTPYLQRSESIATTTERSSSPHSNHDRAESPVYTLHGVRPRQLPQPPQTNIATTSCLPPPWKQASEKTRPRSHTEQCSLAQQSSTSRIPPSPETAQEQYMRRSLEKEATEVAAWVRSLTPEQRHHHRRAAASSHTLAFDAPPPAYNAIDFSHPPHAAAPSSSPTALPPLPH